LMGLSMGGTGCEQNQGKSVSDFMVGKPFDSHGNLLVCARSRTFEQSVCALPR